MKDYVNWAVLAPGRIANSMAKAMSETSKKDQTVRLYAVASRSYVRADNFAKQWGFSKSYGDYESLYNDPKVDAVYVANPHSLHYKTVMNLLKNGKHVLCEKPAGCNVEQLIEMMKFANSNDLFFMEAMWSAFNPTLHKIREYIDSGKLGSLLNIDSKFCLRTEFDKESRLWNPSLAGGALLDLGIYNVFFAMFMNHFKGVEFFSSDVRMRNNVDAWNNVSIKFSNKVTTTFQSSIDVPSVSKTHDAVIYCSKGYIIVRNFFMAQEAEIYLYDSDKGNECKLAETISVPFEINGYEYEFREATKQILAGNVTSDIYTFTDSIYLSTVLTDIRQQWNFKYPFE